MHIIPSYDRQRDRPIPPRPPDDWIWHRQQPIARRGWHKDGLVWIPKWETAAAFRSASNTTFASRTNTIVTAPAGIVDADVLVLLGLTGAATTAPTATPPAGFAEVTGTWPVSLTDTGSFNVRVWIWYKIAASESGNYTFTHASASSQGEMMAVSGGASAKPNATQNNGTGLTSTALGLTTVADQSLVAYFGTDWGTTGNNLSPPAGTTPTFTERLDIAPLVYLATGILSPAGATGDKTQTNNSGLSDPWSAYLVAIEAAGAATAGLFKPNPMTGLGVGGPFFPDPLSMRRHGQSIYQSR